MVIKKCAHCNKPFAVRGDPGQKYHSLACKKKAENRRYQEKKRQKQNQTLEEYRKEMRLAISDAAEEKFADLIAQIVADDEDAIPNDEDIDLAKRFVKVVKLKYKID